MGSGFRIKGWRCGQKRPACASIRNNGCSCTCLGWAVGRSRKDVSPNGQALCNAGIGTRAVPRFGGRSVEEKWRLQIGGRKKYEEKCLCIFLIVGGL